MVNKDNLQLIVQGDYAFFGFGLSFIAFLLLNLAFCGVRLLDFVLVKSNRIKAM